MNRFKITITFFTFNIIGIYFPLFNCTVNSSSSSFQFHNFNCTRDSSIENLKNSKIIAPRPLISIGDSRAPKEKVENKYARNKDVTVLKCDFSKPIEWAFYAASPFNFQQDGLTTINNYFERVVKNIGNASVSTYLVDFDLLYTRSEVKKLNITIACEAIENEDPCEKSYVGFNPISSNFEKIRQPSFPLGERKVVPSYLHNETTLECKATLLIHQTEENEIIYKWVPTVNNSKITHQKTFTYNNLISFWNAYKDLEKDFQCLDSSEYSDELQNCTKNCKKVNYIIEDISIPENVTSNAIVFYAKFDGVPIVQKGLFSIQRDNEFRTRKFLMLRDVSFSDMMYLDLPFEVIYTEKEYLVTCWVSTFYFAVGTLISINEDPIQEVMNNDAGNIKEVYNRYNSSRMVTRIIKFTSEYGNTNQTMTCFAPKIYSSDWHNDSRTIYVENSSFPIFLGNGEEEFIVYESHANFTMSCSFQGIPKPEILWELPTPELTTFVEKFSNETEHFSGSSITFPMMTKNLTGLYTCTGGNFRGNVSKTFTVKLPPNDLAYTLKLSLGISIGAAVLLFMSVILLLVRRLRIEQQLFRIQAEQVMKDFRDGCTLYSKDIFDAHFSILKQPYNTEYEVPLDRWSIGNRILGSGEFGIVKQGTVQIENSQVKVAIKTTRHSPDIADFKGFLDELKIMAFIGVHDNIVSLVAAFSDDNNARNVLIGVEFCDNGSLLDYVRARKETFHSMVTPEGYLTTDFNENSIEQAKTESPQLTTANLYLWSYQIANGLEYLEKKKVLHSDLATRNVLLSANIVAKISDFGLSRILQNADNYTKKTKCPLPWKWMAIESLRDMEFSTHSDMWAYGVTLWELYALCKTPWEDQSWSVEFIVELIHGRRLARPFGATNNIYSKIMAPAWHPIPEQRLLPTQAKAFFWNVLEGSFKDG